MDSQRPLALETRVQFTVRGVLLGTTLIAIGVALVAPWFQQWTAEQRRSFLWTWCALGVGAGVAVVVASVRRVRAERRAGAARYRLPRSTLWPAVLMALFWAAMVVAYSLFMALGAGGVPARGLWLGFLSLQYGAMFAIAALRVWWRADCLELCDAGLLRGSLLIPWANFCDFHWGTFDPNTLILQGRWGITTWRVDPDRKAAIEHFLASHVAAAHHC
ncbi:MAG TPA: hypothetical protein VHC22_12245 [Pirellulales bacterium]|nr:hypothetical protein [Pirellulales bacterium]